MKTKKNVLNSLQKHWLLLLAGLVLIIIVLIVVIIIQAFSRNITVPNCDEPVQNIPVFKNDFERLAFLQSFNSLSIKSVFVDFEDEHKTDIEIEDPQTIRSVTESFFGKEMTYEGVNIDYLNSIYRVMTITFKMTNNQYTLELYSWAVFNAVENEDYVLFDGTFFYPSGEHDYYSAIMREYYYQREKSIRPSIVN